MSAAAKMNGTEELPRPACTPDQLEQVTDILLRIARGQDEVVRLLDENTRILNESNERSKVLYQLAVAGTGRME